MTLVDTNVLLDIFTPDSRWLDWSRARLRDASLRGSLLINDVIYAETSARYRDMGDFERALANVGVVVAPVPRDALFLAGKAFVKYRAAGGGRTGVLSDFFIGAHATVQNIPIVTRDVRRYRHYFPTLQLIAPEA
jgi:predicted nucleic acid-binding protein